MATPTKEEVKSTMNGAHRKAEEVYDKAEEKLSAVAENLNQISDKVKRASSDLADKSIEMAQKYPVHTALGAVAVGFVLGAFIARRR